MEANRSNYLMQATPSRFRTPDLFQLKRTVLKTENENCHVYKYCSVETAVKIFETGKILLQQPDKFNDPFDCLAQVGGWDFSKRIGPDAEHMSDLMELLGKVPNHLRATEFRVSNDLRFAYGVRVTCFSSNCLNHLMWSHYAGYHTGVCLEYDMEDYIEWIHPCSYLSSLSGINWLSHDLRLALVKNADWSYEQEWRVIKRDVRPLARLVSDIYHPMYNSCKSTEERERLEQALAPLRAEIEERQREVSSVKSSPRRIILGAAFQKGYSNVHRKKLCNHLIEMARQENVDVYRVLTSPETFSLAITPFSATSPSFVDFHPELRRFIVERKRVKREIS